LSVCSRSSCPPWLNPPPRRRPTASISSRKMMQGDDSLACLNRSRTRLAPTPTNISTKSEPEIEKNGTSASPAIALASSVLPQPGSPTSSTPRGMRPPRRVNFLGFLRNSMISVTSSLASSMPATSLKVTPVISLVSVGASTLAEVAEHAPAAARRLRIGAVGAALGVAPASPVGKPGHAVARGRPGARSLLQSESQEEGSFPPAHGALGASTTRIGGGIGFQPER
jgi:hypothetical protein